MKLKEYLENLLEQGKKYPELLEMELIYSKDDEGNEFNSVISTASPCEVENLEDGGDYIILGYAKTVGGDIELKNCNAIVIN